MQIMPTLMITLPKMNEHGCIIRNIIRYHHNSSMLCSLILIEVTAQNFHILRSHHIGVTVTKESRFKSITNPPEHGQVDGELTCNFFRGCA